MNTTYREVHMLLHRLWTRAVGTPDYNKADWKVLERLLEDLWREATGKAPSVEPEKAPERPTAWARLR